jgi:hypothetical protein
MERKMKRTIVLILIAVIVISTNLFAGLPKVEDIAKEVLKAYKTKDVELLKKNASGMLINAISKSYFQDKGIQDDLKVVENWDGNIKEIRYVVENMMGKKITMAMVHYSDAADSKKINVVLLSTMDNEKWVFIGSGLSTEKKENFEKMSKTIEAGETKAQAKSTKKKVVRNKRESNKKFDLEMFSGDNFQKVTQEKVIECFNTLNDDNFFVGLSSKDDWIQVAYSDNGYSFEGNEGGVHFASKDLLSKEKAIQFLKDYYTGNTDWESKAEFDK